MGGERKRLVELPYQPPAFAVALPVHGVFGPRGLAPPPPGVGPVLAARVAAVAHELRELGIGHRRSCDAKRPDLDRVAPLLVVEHERRVAGCAGQELPARHGHVAGQSARPGIGRRSRVARRRESRSRIAERLARPRERLVVHVLVERGELVEVAVHRTREPGSEPLEQAVVDPLHVREGLRARRQRQVPALVVMDRDGVVERVAVREQGRLAVHALQDEVLVEPCDVPDLPAHRVDDAQPRPHELLVGEVVDQLPGTHARIADVRFECCRFDLPDRGNTGWDDDGAVAWRIADGQG